MKQVEKLIVILWTDFPAESAPTKGAIAAAGHRCLVRNAANFEAGDFEAAHAIALERAHREGLIRAVYAERGIGVVALNEKGELVREAGGAMTAPAPKPTEQDYLDDRLANMSYEDLRTYVRGITGTEPPAPENDPPSDADVEKLIAMLRTPGANQAHREKQAERDKAGKQAPQTDAETDVIDPGSVSDNAGKGDETNKNTEAKTDDTDKGDAGKSDTTKPGGRGGRQRSKD